MLNFAATMNISMCMMTMRMMCAAQNSMLSVMNFD